MKIMYCIAGLMFAVITGAIAQSPQPRPEARKTSSMSGEASAPSQMKVEDFELLDQQGRRHGLHRQPGKAVVLISTANGCPVVKQAASTIKALRDKFGNQGVEFWLLDSNPDDDRAGIAREAEQLGLDLPVLEDRAQLVADVLGISQTSEVVCIG